MLTVMVTWQPVSASSTLVITPSTPLPDQDFTISGQFTGIGGGIAVNVYVYPGSGCTGIPVILGADTSDSPPGSWSVTGIFDAGSYSAQAVDFNDASACVNFNVGSSPPIPPPVGGVVTSVNTLAVLAPWLTVIGLVGCIGAVVVVAKKRRP
jgi:hypothetical protein